MNKLITLLILGLFLSSCQQQGELEDALEKSGFSTQCSGTPTMRGNYRVYGLEVINDDVGVLKKYEYYKVKNSESCYKQEVPLSYFEEGIRKRHRTNIECTPQPYLANEIYLKSANNYYTYRDGKIFVHLDPFTGEYRRVLIGEDKDGNQLHSKEIGCFYIREDLENEPWGNLDYGVQLFLEQPKSASSNASKANEVYRLDDNGTNFNLTAFDQISDWSHSFCPYGKTPWGFCDLLRNGNILYESVLTVTQKSQLLAEARLIRTQYNFLRINQIDFDEKWDLSQKYEGEEPQENFKYTLKFVPDGPYYTEQAWIEYIKGERPYMPDTSIISQRPVCYNGFKEVILDDGSSSYIRGEVCYIDGNYVFTDF